MADDSVPPTQEPATGDTPPAVATAAPTADAAEITAETLATTAFAAPDFDAPGTGGRAAGIELLDDVELDVTVELGRAEMYIEDVLRLGPGSVVQLDKLAGDSVDVYVNQQLVARGEVLVLNENFCVRVNEIISPLGELDAAK